MDRSAPYRERHYAAQDGLRLYCREYGDPLTPGPTVLCLPGLTRNCGDFEALAARLARDRRVLCPDYRGRGRSARDPDWRHYAPERTAADIVDLLAAAGAHPVVVIGSSMGGLLGMGLATIAPTALAGLVLNDIAPWIERAELDRMTGMLSADRPHPDWASAEADLRVMFPKLRFRDEAAWSAMARHTWREGPDGMLHFDYDVAVIRPLRVMRDFTPRLERLYRAVRRLPVLAIRGESSALISAAAFDRMVDEKPDLVRLTVAGAGHTPTLEEPEARAAIDAFLDRF